MFDSSVLLPCVSCKQNTIAPSVNITNTYVKISCDCGYLIDISSLTFQWNYHKIPTERDLINYAIIAWNNGDK